MAKNELELGAKIDDFLAKIEQARAAIRQLKDEASAVQIGGGGMSGATASFAANGSSGGARATVASSASTATGNMSGLTGAINAMLGAPMQMNTPGGTLALNPQAQVNLQNAQAHVALGQGTPSQSGSGIGSAAANFSVGARSGYARGTFSVGAGTALGLEAGYGVARLAGEGFEYQTNRIMQGGSGMMEQADLLGSGLSLGIGAAAGFATMNPLIGVAAAGIAQSALSPLIRSIYAPMAMQLKAEAMLTPTYGAYYGQSGASMAHTAVGAPTDASGRWRGGNLNRLTNFLNSNLAGTDLFGTLENVAAGYSAVAGGMLAGGTDPFGNVRGYNAGLQDVGTVSGTGFGAVLAGMGNIGIEASRLTHPNRLQENAAETVTRRLGQIFGTAGIPEAAKAVAPIYSALPETGGNTADILMQFGAQDTASYLRTTNDDLSLPDGMSTMGLARSSAAIRAGQRLARIKSVQARGAARGTMAALGGELLDIAGIPGGVDSALYAETNAAFRQVGQQAFEANNIVRNEIPLTRLGNQRSILQTLPFAPASMMRNSLATISAERQELSDLTAYERTRRSSGQLSEAEELQLTQREGAARLGIAQGLFQLSEGMENRLPELSAGRPSRTGRYNSVNLAASAVRLAGGYYRGFGAETGGQRQSQDSLINELGFGADEVGPRSRSQGVNSQGETNSILRQILSALQKNGNQGGAPSNPANGRPGTAMPNGSMPGNPFGNYSDNRN